MNTSTTGPELDIGLSLDDRAWLDDLGLTETELTDWIAKRIGRVVAQDAGRLAGAATPIEISILLTSDAQVQTLNAQYRGKDTPTNVLAFPALDLSSDHVTGAAPPGEPIVLGDIVLARETTIGEAQDQGKSRLDHFSHLVVHGMLHLLGCDHLDDDQAAHMETREIAILASLGIQNPYDDPD